MLRKRILVVLALGFAGIARANLVDSNSIIQDGIEYYIQTDKFVYGLGENVQMLYRVTNLRDESVTFGFGWYPVYQFLVEKEGEQIWSAIDTRLAVVTELTLMPGESRVFPDDFTPPFIWDMRDKGNLVDLGTYNVIGGLYSVSGYYNYTKVAVPIAIIPEPATIFLLGAGFVSVIFERAKQ